MNPFDNFGIGGSAPGNDFLRRFAANFAEGVRGAVRDGQRAISQLGQWGAQLAQNAPIQWAEHLARPAECAHSRRCHEQALVTCIKCRGAHCLAHTMLNHLGEGLCMRCVCEAAGLPVPADSPIEDALRTLELDPEVEYELDEIADQYKRLAKKHHPDRARTSKSKASAEVKMRDLNLAYDAVRKFYKEEAA